MALTIRQNVAQQIVEAVKAVCSHDINFINTNGIIFASTNQQRIGDFHEIGRQAALRAETIEVATDEGFQGTKRGVNIPFIYRGEVSAVIGISGDPEEVRKYAYLAQKITALILREQELEVHEHIQKTQLNQLIRSIVSKEYVNSEYLNETLKKYHADPLAEYRTIIVKLDSRYHPSNLSMIEKYIYEAFENAGSALYTSNYANEYILLLESEKLSKIQYLFQKLGETHAPLLRIGIGVAMPLTKQYKSYQAAKIAVGSLIGEESLAIFDYLDLEILLGDISEETKLYFLKHTISQLTEKDKKVLKAYFSSGMSLKKTCEQLYLHKNTLQYQLDRISRITGYNPRQFKDAVVLYLGLKME